MNQQSTPLKNEMVEPQNYDGLLELLGQPESLGVQLTVRSSSDKQKGNKVRLELQQICQILFRRIEQLASLYNQHIPKENSIGSQLSGLDCLHLAQIGENDELVNAEMIFGQIDVQNRALQKLLKKSNKALSKSVDSGRDIRLLDEDSDEEGEIEAEDDEFNEVEMEGHSDDDDSGGDEDERRIRERMERVMEEMEDDDDDDDQAEKEAESKRSEIKASETNTVDPAAEELNDGFFDINEMEEFADEEEEYLPDEAFGEEEPHGKRRIDDDNRSFHQKLREGDSVNDSDEDDDDDEEDLLVRARSAVRRRRYREDDEIDALFKLYKEPDNQPDSSDEEFDATKMTAADLFGKPARKYYDKWYGTKSRRNHSGKGLKDDDDSWDEYEFDRMEQTETTGWNDAPVNKQGYVADEVENHTKEDMDDEMQTKTDGPVPSKDSDPMQEKLRTQIETLENDMISEKPWQMKGEIPGTARPLDSLLDSTPEFEIAAKQAPAITVERTADLEEVIKKRILDEDWDDVVPRELPDVAWNTKKGELPEVAQEKSKLSLGELYEREYLKKVAGYDVDAAEKETEEDKVKNEMRTLFANLCSKLDALSNYHFVPRPVADEAEIRPVAKPAIAMEEVLPLHVSDARGVAPEEVHGTKRGREGVLRGDSELEQEDKKRIRSSKKAARRKARKEKAADEKLISRLEPGLGLNNPYEKRKMREELAAARARGKVSTGEEDTNSYGKSTTFFKRMQIEAREAILDKQNSAETGKRRQKKDSSGSLKL